MGVVLDYEPCDECKENRKLGVTLMEVSEDPVLDGFPEIQNGIYPTGRWCVIRKEAADRMFEGFLDEKNALFVDQEIYDYVVGGNAQ
jgi:hypothetical protein